MKAMIRKLLNSTKFLTFIATMISAVIARRGYDVPIAEIQPWVELVIGWLVAQGLADFGKNAKSIVPLVIASIPLTQMVA